MPITCYRFVTVVSFFGDFLEFFLPRREMKYQFDKRQAGVLYCRK
jgi:hypothetical protein